MMGGLGSLGAVGVGSSLEAVAAGAKKVRAELKDDEVFAGQRLVLRVWRNGLEPGSKIRVTDSRELRWKRVAGSHDPQRWTAAARGSGKGTVRVRVLGADGLVVHDPRFHDRVDYRIRGGMRGPLIGMHAEPHDWAQRVSEVGPGLAARRIYGDLSLGPTHQLKVVEQAHEAGMLPVISYKVGRDIAGAVRGDFNGVAKQAAKHLASFGLPTAVSFWHEPLGDMSGHDFAAASRQLLPIFKRGKLRVGPILNGWLLDRRRDDFTSFCPENLLRICDWMGIDTYESGTPASPGPVKPADRIPALVKYMRSRGHPHMPLAVAEYNGYSGRSIADVGEALFTTPNIWFGCVWNRTGGIGHVLTGDRLTAFRKTLADPRARKPRSVG
jgi:hypothetical protein